MKLSSVKFILLQFILVICSLFHFQTFAEEGSKTRIKPIKTKFREADESGSDKKGKPFREAMKESKRLSRCLSTIWSPQNGGVAPVPEKVKYSQQDKEQTKDEVNKASNRIVYQLSMQNIDAAIILLQKAITDWPRKVRFRIILAKAYVQKGEMALAENELYFLERDIVGSKLQNIEILKDMYIVKYSIAASKGDSVSMKMWYSQWLNVVNGSITSSVFYGEVNALQASAQFYRGEVRSAIGTLVTSINYNAESVFALRLREIILQSLRDKYREQIRKRMFSECLSTLELMDGLLAKGTPSEIALSYYQKARVYYELGKSVDQDSANKSFQKALEYVNASLELNGKYGHALMLAAIINLKIKNFEAANSLLDKARSYVAETDFLLAHKARVASGKGNFHEAIDLIEEQIKTYPYQESYDWIYKMFLTLNNQMENLDSAIEFLQTHIPAQTSRIVKEWNSELR